jgi:hypothetical protein
MLRAGIGTIALLLAGLAPLADALADGGPAGPEVATERRTVRTVRMTPAPPVVGERVQGTSPSADPAPTGRTVRRVVEPPRGAQPVPVSPSSGTWVQQRWVSADSPRTTRVVWVRVPDSVESEPEAPAPRRVVVAQDRSPARTPVSYPAPAPGNVRAPRARVLIPSGSLPCDT